MLILQRRHYSLSVLCIDHKGGKAAGLRQIFDSGLDANAQYYRPFLFEDVVGMISRFGDSTVISAFNVKSGEHVLIPTNLPTVSVLVIEVIDLSDYVTW